MLKKKSAVVILVPPDGPSRWLHVVVVVVVLLYGLRGHMFYSHTDTMFAYLIAFPNVYASLRVHLVSLPNV